MPRIISALSQNCVERNGVLELAITAHFADHTHQDYTLSVSYEKHAISAYKGSHSTSLSTQANTLIDMSLEDFTTAFENYGRLIAEKMIGEDNATFAPSAPCHRIATKGIAFSSGLDKLENHIQCFPAHVSPTRTPKAIKLSQSLFEHFKHVSNFFVTQKGDLKRTKQAWKALQPLIRNTKHKPCQLFSELETKALNIALYGQPVKIKHRGFLRLQRILSSY